MLLERAARHLAEVYGGKPTPLALEAAVRAGRQTWLQAGHTVTLEPVLRQAATRGRRGRPGGAAPIVAARGGERRPGAARGRRRGTLRRDGRQPVPGGRRGGLGRPGGGQRAGVLPPCPLSASRAPPPLPGPDHGRLPRAGGRSGAAAAPRPPGAAAGARAGGPGRDGRDAGRRSRPPPRRARAAPESAADPQLERRLRLLEAISDHD